MSATDLDALLERMPGIVDVVERFSSEAVQLQALDALISAFRHGHTAAKPSPAASPPSNDPVDTPPVDEQVAGETAKPAKKVPAKKAGGKNKLSFTVAKDLDLLHGGTPPFREFADSKDPKTATEKCLIAVYWLTRNATNPVPATIEQVYTCFKHMEWMVPTDLANTLQQAGTKGWLNSAKREDLKVPVNGENRVEHEMPAKPKKQSGAAK